MGGGTYQKCQCDSYIDFCGIYQNKPGYENDAKTLKYCSIATCCKKETDDEGRKVCLEGSFKTEPVSGSISDLVATDSGQDTDATSDSPPSRARNAKNLALSVAGIGALSLLLIS